VIHGERGEIQLAACSQVFRLEDRSALRTSLEVGGSKRKYWNVGILERRWEQLRDYLSVSHD
jgi:hypothetical protein